MIEKEFMPQIIEAWHTTARNRELKPRTKTYEKQLALYMQGVLAALTASGRITMDRANQIGLLLMLRPYQLLETLKG